MFTGRPEKIGQTNWGKRFKMGDVIDEIAKAWDTIGLFPIPL